MYGGQTLLFYGAAKAAGDEQATTRQGADSRSAPVKGVAYGRSTSEGQGRSCLA